MECYGSQAKSKGVKEGPTGVTGQLSLGRRLESLHRDDLEENLKRWVDALLGGREDIGALCT